MRLQQPVPVTILTGFLGAGKTTLLNYLLHSDHGLRVAIIVNDFGAINIDTRLIVGVEGETVSLANGCICCSIRTDLLRTAVDLIGRPEPPEYIIVETSGVSDPASVASTFLLPELKPYLRVDSILTVVDAEQVRSLEDENYFLAMEQVGVADIVILNKVDLVDAAKLIEIKDWIHEITSRARILETTYGRVPLSLVLGVGAYDAERLSRRAVLDVHAHEAGEVTEHEHKSGEHDHALVFETWHWESDQPLSSKALRKTVEHLPLGIYRAKGFVYLEETPERKGILHVVGKRANLTYEPSWGDEPPHTQLVFIGEHGKVDADDLRARFEATVAGKQPGNEFSRITEGMMSWLRRGK